MAFSRAQPAEHARRGYPCGAGRDGDCRRQPAAAHKAAERALQLDPFRGDAHRLVMRAMAGAGHLRGAQALSGAERAAEAGI